MKNSYILLRNNRESASLHLEDLQNIGLKPGDLIWVECQSVSWRSPKEIPELKALVSENDKGEINNNNEPPIEDIPLPFETMPPKNIEKEDALAEKPLKEEFIEKESLKPLADSLSANMKKYADPDNSGKYDLDNKEIGLNVNYSRSLDEIKEMYVKNLGKKEQRGKSIIKIELPEQVKKIVLYAGLIAAGAIIMLFIKKNTGSENIALARTDNKQADTAISTYPAQPMELKQAITDTTESFKKQNIQPEEEKLPVAINKGMPLKKNSEKDEDKEIKNENTVINTKPENEIKTPKPVSPENISSKLSLKANDYNVGSFGGIRNLEMTLQNDSKYLLDRVTVEIKYLNPEGIILKTDNIIFQSIQPGDALTIPVNKTKRGVKVDYKITKIESKELVSNLQKTTDPGNYTSN